LLSLPCMWHPMLCSLFGVCFFWVVYYLCHTCDIPCPIYCFPNFKIIYLFQMMLVTNGLMDTFLNIGFVFFICWVFHPIESCHLGDKKIKWLRCWRFLHAKLMFVSCMIINHSFLVNFLFTSFSISYAEIYNYSIM
jgi:hypothetical protein